MITFFRNLTKENYATYVNQDSGKAEKHTWRIIFQFIISIIICSATIKFSDNLISVTVTALSILVGFAFSALFSLASDVKAGLPEPRFPEDKDDISRLLKLSSTFQNNASYFLTITLTCIVLLLTQMINLHIPKFTLQLPPEYTSELCKIFNILGTVNDYLYFFLRFTSVFLLLESMYTFFRMGLSISYILRIRDEYAKERK